LHIVVVLRTVIRAIRRVAGEVFLGICAPVRVTLRAVRTYLWAAREIREVIGAVGEIDLFERTICGVGRVLGQGWGTYTRRGPDVRFSTRDIASSFGARPAVCRSATGASGI
jgi:hypothetical protein